MIDMTLFGDEVVSANKFVRNRTNANKERAPRLTAAHITPSHNIVYATETNNFLREMLRLHTDKAVTVEQILYHIGKQITGKTLDEYKEFESNLNFKIPHLVSLEHDLLGSVYQFLTTKRERLEIGSFYTSKSMVEDIVKNIEISSTDTVFDPACGSGNLLFNSKITLPSQIFGIDNDPTAVMCCKFNYYKKFGNNAPAPQIYCKDFIEFVHTNKRHFNYVICNPPFGATLNISTLYNSTVKTEDSLTYFVEHGAKIANTSIFILPESVINVKKHTPLRQWILNYVNLEHIKSYGATFSGTMFPIVAITLSTKNNTPDFIFDNKRVLKENIKRIPFFYFRPIDKDASIILKKVFDKQSQSLKGSVFALGVVTGDNKSKLFDHKVSGSEPIITGKDITPFEIASPQKYIIYNRDDMQQVAPEELYRAKEKLVYKTVSRSMIFAIDYSGSLTLNSANFIIPKNLTISNKCLMALLNSKLYNKLNEMIYGENKISRTNLENLPIPDISIEQQKEIESYIDQKEYDKIDSIVYSIFDITEE